MPITVLIAWYRRCSCAHVPKSRGASFMEMLLEEMPKMQEDYNPNHGYEPYWPGGDWVFKQPTLAPGETTTKVPLVCGEECNYLYTRIGAVCARQADNTQYEQCVKFLGLCTKNLFDQFWRGFRTFDTYCKFLDAQCKTKFHNRWLLVHEGKCTHDLGKYFKPLQYKNPNNRVTRYFSTLNETYVNASLPSPLRQRPLDVSPPEDDALPLPVRYHINNVIQNALFGSKDDK